MSQGADATAGMGIRLGAHGERWRGVQPLARLGVDIELHLAGSLEPLDFFLVDAAAPCVATVTSPRLSGVTPTVGECCAYGEVVGGSAVNGSGTVGEAMRWLADVHGVREVVPIGAVSVRRLERSAGGHREVPVINYYVVARLDRDLVFSRVKQCPPSITESTGDLHLARLLAFEEHVFVEPELDERAHNDLSIVEREIKFDASRDPRAAAATIDFAQGDDVYSGVPIPNHHYHRVYDIGSSGIVLMASDPQGGDAMLKHKYAMPTNDERVFLRFEVVEPYTPGNLRRLAEQLEPGVVVSEAALTPYFFRDRVKTNVYFARSKHIFEVFGDHSTFLEGEYRPFDQVEIEYVGTIQARSDDPVPLGPEFERSVNDDFARLKDIVVERFAAAGVTLETSRRSKYDWAREEVFRR